MGKNCILELAKEDPDRILELFTSHSVVDKQLESLPVVKVVPKQKLEQLVDSSSHQGYVALVKRKEPLSLKHYLNKATENDLLLMVDSVEDPQNLGTIFRAAECFGVAGIVLSKNRGVSVTPVVSKVSVGGSELIPIVAVSNLAEACRQLKKEGFFVYAAENEPGAMPFTELPRDGKRVLIVGSEGKGIQQLLKKTADVRTFIPMKGRINSVNVSQATAIFLAQMSA